MPWINIKERLPDREGWYYINFITEATPPKGLFCGSPSIKSTRHYYFKEYLVKEDEGADRVVFLKVKGFLSDPQANSYDSIPKKNILYWYELEPVPEEVEEDV